MLLSLVGFSMRRRTDRVAGGGAEGRLLRGLALYKKRKIDVDCTPQIFPWASDIRVLAPTVDDSAGLRHLARGREKSVGFTF